MSGDYRALPGVPWSTLGVIALGGAIGALARYGLLSAFPAPPSGFPFSVLAINVTGCLLIGAVNVLLAGHGWRRDVLRPFLGTGVLGGFTTFSTFVAGLQRELAGGEPRMALAYGAVTTAAAIGAAWAGIRAATALARSDEKEAR